MNTQFDFKDKVILVTGAAGGIGGAVVHELEQYHAKIYGTDISKRAHQSFYSGDITDHSFINYVVKDIMEKEGKIDVLINSAGIYLRTPVKDITRAEWERLMDINLTSVFLLSQAIMNVMIHQKSGSIVSLTSVAGKIGGLIAGAHYAASKAAVECLTKSLAKLGAPHGVRVNAVAPGIIDTSMQDDVPPAQMGFLMKNIPMGRLGSPQEVANTILFLASDRSSYITGQNINVNGGTYM